MSKTSSDNLFVLIKSLKKSEKRYFRLIEGRENEHPKFLSLFDYLENQQEYDEEDLLKKLPEIKRQQLSNMKAHLYKKILQSLRQYNQGSVIDLQIRELIDYAQLLFNRSLYDQCVDVLKKAKKKARKIDNLELRLEIIKWEKNVLGLTIGPDNEARVQRILEEVSDVNQRITNVNTFTNLSAQLNTIQTKIGYTRSQEDYEKIYTLIKDGIPDVNESELSVNEKISLYSLYVWYYFFIQDFILANTYAWKWVELYDINKDLRISRTEGYLSAINNLLISQNKLYHYQDFVNTFRRLREIRHYPKNLINENIRLKLLKYTYVHEFNRIFMLGDFKAGVSLMNKIKNGLEEFIEQLDNHSKLILYYKVACLYFGNDNYKEAVQWLNRVINSDYGDLREDIHSFARLLNLICHYELGNTDVLDYYIRSAYRYMLKKDDLYLYQKAILNFIRKLSGEFNETDLIPEFQKLLTFLKPLQEKAYEKRAFIYFDIISWLESKIQGRRVQDVISEKAKKLLI